MIKKLFCVIIFAAIMCMPVVANADGKYSISNGVLTISGTGAMPNYESAVSSPWYSNRQSVTKIVIEDGITRIGNYNFTNFVNVTSVSIPNSILSIGKSSFLGCSSLETILIPLNVQSIDYSSFGNCNSLKNINVSSNNKYYTSENGILFNKDKTVLIQYPLNKQSASYNIPSSVISIESGFYNCSIIESINISSNLMNIKNGSFSRCTNLKEINVSVLNNNYTSIDGVLFNNDISKLIQYPAGKTDTTYVMPYTINELGQGSFASTASIKEVIISNNVEELADGVFDNCNNLNRISLPSKLKIVGKYAFNKCYSLDNLKIPHGTQEIDAYAFNLCTSLKSITIPSTVTFIDDTAFDNTDLTIYCEEGSYAHSYAKRMAIPYEIVDLSDMIDYSVDSYSEDNMTSISTVFNEKVTGDIIVMLFDKNNKCVSKKIQTIDNSQNKIIMLPTNDAISAKIFVWDSIKGMHPISEVKNLNL